MTNGNDLTLLQQSNNIASPQQRDLAGKPMGIVDDKCRIQIKLLPSDGARIADFARKVESSVSDFCSGLLDACLEGNGYAVTKIVEEQVEHLVEYDQWRTHFSKSGEDRDYYAQAFVDPVTFGKLSALSDVMRIAVGNLSSFLISGAINEKDSEILMEYIDHWWPDGWSHWR